ncbi:hypothetical protein [Aestuariivirga sp.]|uniref:hypothetical protein n=1 Tax=Aestuariivirga sp. TaxID=2650926 RepID=UPI003BABDDB0
MAMIKETDNVKRLAEAGILDTSDLTEEGIDAINAIVISEDEIGALLNIKSKLQLESVKLDFPGSKVWRL